VIDAAGAIYVIGGVRSDGPQTGPTNFQDMWASTDGGVRPDSVRGDGRGYSRGYSRARLSATRFFLVSSDD
jgi:hypothetical protein